jgi:hypothetical protein
MVEMTNLPSAPVTHYLQKYDFIFFNKNNIYEKFMGREDDLVEIFFSPCLLFSCFTCSIFTFYYLSSGYYKKKLKIKNFVNIVRYLSSGCYKKIVEYL